MDRTLLVGGQVIDGTGGEPARADVLVEGDRIVQVAPDLPHKNADRVIDATDRVVTPGFVDLHSHYDAQVFWDTTLSSSCHHGVTSVINGNCGFSLAPYNTEHRSLIVGMLRDLEDMYPDTLEAATPKAIPSFAGYMADVEKCGPMLNFGSFIGHSTVRIAVMGPAAYEREATAEEIAAMVALVDDAMKAGAMGFATKTMKGSRHAPSQFASSDETLSLLKALKKHGRGVAMFNPGGAFDLERLYAAQSEIGRPFTWIALMALPDGSHNQRMELHQHWRERGADVRPQVSCRPLTAEMRMSMPSALRATCITELNAMSDAQKLATYADPAFRALARADVKGASGGPVDWRDVVILESPSEPALQGRDVLSVAQSRGQHPLDLLFDLAIADKLVTKVVVTYGNGDVPEVIKLLNVEGAVLGLSDAGAHPAQTCDAVLPTDLLGNWVRGRNAMSFETAIHKLTQEPAELMGMKGRGVVKPGYYADLVVMDPRTVGPDPLRTVKDLPMDRERLLADQPSGIHHILVNGVPTRQDEKTRKVASGRLLQPA
jgi:N-acyl-D-aspartate/D-glutamate deacylase